MRLRIMGFLAMLLLVAACESAPDKGPEMGVGSDRAPISGIETEMVEETGIPPGTQQDLVVNVGDRVFFDYDRFDLKPEARATVERQAQWMKQYPNLEVTIEGHCDERGTREYNLALGEKRANSVKNYLVALGVNPDRIDVVSYGKERPAVLGANPSAWAQNRRGVMVVQ